MQRPAIIKGYADTRDGQVHFRRVEGGPGLPLVFLHQTASSGAMFALVMQRLAAGRPCYALDTPGFGGSFAPEGAPDLVYYAERLVEALDAIGIARFDLCGHHTGGCIALEIAALLPGRVNSLTLIGPVIASEPERNAYRRTFTAPFAISDDGAYLKTAWDYLATIGAGRTIALHHRELIDHLIGVEAMPKAFSAVWDQDSEARLAAVRAPLMLMCSKDDVLWPIFHHAEALRPDAEVAIVDGMDFQPDNDPDGVAAALERFLSRGASG